MIESEARTVARWTCPVCIRVVNGE